MLKKQTYSLMSMLPSQKKKNEALNQVPSKSQAVLNSSGPQKNVINPLIEQKPEFCERRGEPKETLSYHKKEKDQPVQNRQSLQYSRKLYEDHNLEYKWNSVEDNIDPDQDKFKELLNVKTTLDNLRNGSPDFSHLVAMKRRLEDELYSQTSFYISATESESEDK